uniref:Leucine-rich repeat-containing protein 40 n=1 Tax=Branchiostoma floridae TaxID=7739 RepID=C3YCE9_BRAFL|eukprot:XP_002605976.1 hypothetical protein BRAFLDRAFT_126569 [Branchiostoma floridae]
MSRSARARGRRGKFNPRAGFEPAPTGPNISAALLKQARKSGQLNLSNRGLEKVPDTVWRINLDVPEEAKNVTFDGEDRWWEQVDLTKLILASNKLSELSPDLNQLPALVVLDVHDNELTSLPKEIGDLQHLQKLNVSLPFSLGLMSSLKSVNLDGNPLRTIRRDVIQRGTSELLKYLRTRIEEPKGGDAAPLTPDPEPAAPGSTIDTFTVHKTKSINYSNKNAASIPDDLLDTGRDMFVSDMNLSKNVLTTFPVGLVQLAATLTDLNLSFNKLSALGAEIGQLTRLTTLDLRFQQFPSVLYSLVKLENIFANDNHITAIDVDGLLKLPALATLDLQNNDIMQVPPQLGNVTSLRSLQLGGNPFRVPRPAILAKSTADLLEYLRGRIPTCFCEIRTTTDRNTPQFMDAEDPYYGSILTTCSTAKANCPGDCRNSAAAALRGSVNPIDHAAGTTACERLRRQVTPDNPVHLYAHFSTSNCDHRDYLYLGEVCCWEINFGPGFPITYLHNLSCAGDEHPMTG